MRARLPLLLMLSAMLVLAVVAARGESAIPPGSLPGQPDPPEQRNTPPVADLPSGNPFLDLVSGISTGILLLVMAAMLLFGLAGLLATLAGIRRRRRVGPAMPVQLPEANAELPSAGTGGGNLLAAARTARGELDRRVGGPPGDAIIAAWLVLEEAAGQEGVPRLPHQTPTEFTAAVLAGHEVDGSALDELRGLYQRARFGRAGAVTGDDADRARAVLERVAESLRREVGARP